MRKRLIDMYADLKESGSTSDFPLLLANTMNKVLLDKFKGVSSPWKNYTITTPLSDFKAADRVIMAEAPDLLEIEEGGPYTDSKLKENRYQIQLNTFGRTFSISRQTIINDDLGALKMQPERMGRAAARSIIKKIVDQIEGDHNAYDGASLFAVGHSNYGNTTLANTAAGAAAVAAGMAAIRNATEPNSGEKMGLEPKYLLVPPELEDIALRLTNSAQLLPTSTNGGGTQHQNITRLQVLVEPFLTSSTGWYLLADPQSAPVIEVGFLDGKETPDLLIKRAEAVSTAGGGEDPWGFEFDELVYKVRYDWAVALAYYQGIYRGKA